MHKYDAKPTVIGLAILATSLPGALYSDPQNCDLLEISKFVSEAQPNVVQSKYLSVHALLRDFVDKPEFVFGADVNSQGMGPRGVSADVGRLIWMRDRAPVWGFDPGRARPEPIVLNYVNPFAERGVPEAGISHYIPVKAPESVPKDATSVKVGGRVQYAVGRNFPGILEGGNVQWTNHRTRPYIFTSLKTVEQNRYVSSSTVDKFKQQVQPRLTGTQTTADRWVREFFDYLRNNKLKLPEREQTGEDIRKSLSDTTGVPIERVIITPWMPGETTGHVDVWLGTLPGNLLAVPYIPERLIERLGYDHERLFSKGINDWLNQRVVELSQLPGVKVIRLPMLPPKNLKPSTLSPLGYDGQILSSVNFVTTGGRALVGEHKRWMNELPAAEQQSIRNEITTVLKSAGFETEFIGADQLMDKKGGIHCATADFPDFIQPNAGP